MYVCLCNAVTDSGIRKAVDDGVRNLKQLRQETGCGDTCGSCNEMAVDLLQRALSERRDSQSLLPILQLA
jgi:bacterioferritin-associated ferredoxin